MKKPDAYFDVEWRITPGVGGPMLINVIHEIDTMRYLLGEVESIQGFLSNLNRGNPVEDTGVACIRFKNGTLLSYVFCDGTPSMYGYELVAHEDVWFHPADRDCYYFFGDKAQLSFPSMNITSYNKMSGASDWAHPMHLESLPVPKYNPLEGELDLLVRMMNGTAETRCSAEDATETLRCVEAFRESARTGQAIRMDDFRR